MKTIRSIGAAIVLAAASGIGAMAVSAQHGAPATNDASRAPMTAENRAKDIAAFRELFMARDKSFSDTARAEAETRLATLEKNVGSVSQAYFDLELARIVALSDNGHTHYVLGSISRYYNRVPIRLATFGEDFYVVRAIDADADLLGAKLVSIDGHPVKELREAGRSLWGGVAAFRDRFAFNLFESPELLRAIGLAAADGAATYRFETKTGMVERKLAGDPASDTRPFSQPIPALFPSKLPLEDASWKTALTADKAPWALQDWGKTFRWRAAPELKALVLDMRANVDAADQKMADALAMFDAAIAAEKPTSLVLDMRFNGGGNLNTTRAFMKSLPEKIPGRIFVLTSPFTFSAGISSVGYLEQAGPDKVTIVGEAVGDRLLFWAEGRGADLPNNRGMIGLATQRHDYAGGCKAYMDCHVSVKVAPIAVTSLAPDIAAPWTIEAYLSGRDPAMEAVAAALR
jgi:hypothetical protein